MSGKSDLAIAPCNEQPTLPQSPSIKSRLFDIGTTAALTLHQIFVMNTDFSEMYGYFSAFPTIHIFEATVLFRIPKIIKAMQEDNYFVLFSTLLAWGLVLVPTYGVYIAIIIDLSTLALSYTPIEHKINELVKTKILHKSIDKNKQIVTLQDPNILENAYHILECENEDKHTVKSVTDKYQTKKNILTQRQARLPPFLAYQPSLMIKNLDDAYKTIMKHLSEQHA